MTGLMLGVAVFCFVVNEHGAGILACLMVAYFATRLE